MYVYIYIYIYVFIYGDPRNKHNMYVIDESHQYIESKNGINESSSKTSPKRAQNDAKTKPQRSQNNTQNEAKTTPKRCQKAINKNIRKKPCQNRF